MSTHIEEKPNMGTQLEHADAADMEKANSTPSSVMDIAHAKGVRKLLFKLDILILPLAMLLYLSANLDRNNLGNARLQGLEKNVLENDDTKYSLALACFYITYITCSIPGTLLAKQIVPSTAIACGCAIWAIAATMQAAAFNPAGLYVCRLFVGIGEAMFGQSMALYLSMWYRKDELTKRVGFFISAGALAGAFGGLISFGVSSIASSAIPQYKILFLLEGIPSAVLALVIFFFLPNRPQTSRYLTEEERAVCLARLNADGLLERSDGIDWRGVRRAFTDWKTYTVSLMYSCMNLGIGSVGGFLPTIIKGLGYSDAQAQLFTVPPYAVALVYMLLMTTFSDHKKSRGIPIMTVFCIGVLGWGILYGVSPVGVTEAGLRVRYFGCICVVVAGYTNIPLIIGWQSNNTGNQSQRAVSLGMLNTIGQCLSVLASYSFPSIEGPIYKRGIILNISFQAFGFLIATCMTLYYRYENRRRDRVEGGRPEIGAALEVVEKHDLAPGFRYVP